MAAKLGLPDMVIALLASGANPNIYDYVIILFIYL